MNSAWCRRFLGGMLWSMSVCIHLTGNSALQVLHLEPAGIDLDILQIRGKKNPWIKECFKKNGSGFILMEMWIIQPQKREESPRFLFLCLKWVRNTAVILFFNFCQCQLMQFFHGSRIWAEMLPWALSWKQKFLGNVSFYSAVWVGEDLEQGPSSSRECEIQVQYQGHEIQINPDKSR